MRPRLSALPLALLLISGAHTATAQQQDRKTINLLSVLDPEKDVAGGKWETKGGVLSSIKGGDYCKIRFPYRPPAEYDYHIVLQRYDGDESATFIFVAGGKQFDFQLGGWHNSISGFEIVGGAGANGNKSTVSGKSILENGKTYDFLAKVRKDGIEVLLNGKFYTKLTTNYSDMSSVDGWKIGDETVLGLAADKSGYHFSKIEVVEITGHGEVQKRTTKELPVAGSAPKPDHRELIDISVACAAPPTSPVKAIAPVEPDAIERPEYHDVPKSLVKSLSSITALVVVVSNDGDCTGKTADIIASVPGQSRREDKAGVGFFRQDGDETMKKAFEEAVRAVTLRYPIWEPGHIDISFGETSVGHSGPSAGTAFALLTLSVLEGFDIDPKFGVTGDISVDWRVRAVGGVGAKLRGAFLDECRYAAIPGENEVAFADMGVFYGHHAYWDLQVFSVETVQDAQALVRKDRSPELTEAMKIFADLQQQLSKSEYPTLRKPETVQTLKHILQLAPNHLSAKYCLALAQNAAPKTLSVAGTSYYVGIAWYPYKQVLEAKDLDIGRLKAVAGVAQKRLDVLRPIADKSLLPVVIREAAFIQTVNSFLQGTTTAKNLHERAEALDSQLETSFSDPAYMEKAIREGY